MWYRNTYRFSPFYKSVEKIVVKKISRNPPPPKFIDNKYKKTLHPLIRIQLGTDIKKNINKLPNNSKSE